MERMTKYGMNWDELAITLKSRSVAKEAVQNTESTTPIHIWDWEYTLQKPCAFKNSHCWLLCNLIYRCLCLQKRSVEIINKDLS